MAPLTGSSETIGSLKKQQFDVIIVGGGLAGLVLATRLSEDSSKSILVIEAGGDHIHDPRVDTPGLMATLWEDPEYDWGFWSTPQKWLDGRQIQQPRGKLLGGSSAVNYTAIVYPSRCNFDAWTALGNRGWSADEMAPYFRKFHTFQPGSDAMHEMLSIDRYMQNKSQGKEGPVKVTFTDTYGPFNEAWMKTFDVMGMNDNNDPIDGKKLGAFTPPNSIDTTGKVRSYSASAYYTDRVAARPNLVVVTGTQVEKIVFDEPSRDVTARGVQVRCRDGTTDELVGKEIILSAGSFQSPQILELSGIGSKDVLRKQGIEPVIDNPAVGENLQDHAFAAYSFEVADGQTSGDVVRDPKVIEMLLTMYNESRTGPFSGMPMSMAYLPAVDIDGPMKKSDVEHLLSKYLQDNPPASPSLRSQYEQLRELLLNDKESACQSGILPSQMHFNPGKTSMSQAMAKLLPGNYVSFTVGVNHPFSRGSVHITSPFVKDAPEIDPNYLSHPLDLEILARGTQFVQSLAAKSPIRDLLKQPQTRLPADLDLSNLQDAREAVKKRLFTSFHPCGTCAMLPRQSGGVVDDVCKVYGTTNVRVVDASIFPMITLGNIQASVYAVAERASDLIKDQWHNA